MLCTLDQQDNPFTHLMRWDGEQQTLIFIMSEALWAHVVVTMNVIHANHSKNALHTNNTSWTPPPEVVGAQPLSFGYNRALRVVRDTNNPTHLYITFTYQSWFLEPAPVSGDAEKRTTWDVIVDACTSLAFFVEAIFCFQGHVQSEALQYATLSMHIDPTQDMSGWCMSCHISPHTRTIIALLTAHERSALQEAICRSMEKAQDRLYGRQTTLERPRSNFHCRVEDDGLVFIGFGGDYGYAPDPNRNNPGYVLHGANMDNPLQLLVCLAGIAGLETYLRM